VIVRRSSGFDSSSRGALAEDNPIPRELGQRLHVTFCLTKPPAAVLAFVTDTRAGGRRHDGFMLIGCTGV
jgi:hypothetical protein